MKKFLIITLLAFVSCFFMTNNMQEEQKENVGLEELLNESVEKREDSLAKKKFIEEKREEEIKEFKEYLKTVLNEDGERKYSDSKLDEMSYVELSLLVEEEKKLQTTKTTTTEELDKEEQKESDSKESELVQPDIDEINLKNIEKNATTPETDQKIIENYTPTPERAEKLKKGKNQEKETAETEIKGNDSSDEN